VIKEVKTKPPTSPISKGKMIHVHPRY